MGYKIGLELLIKCNFQKILEIPIHFSERRFGQSKLSFHEQLRYIQHLRRLFIYKYPNLSYLTQFGVVGISGVVVNLLVLTLLLLIHVPVQIAVGLAILISMISNFALNRRFTFSYARGGSIGGQFVGFMTACLLGAVVNYITTIGVLAFVQDLLPQLAALVGILAGTAFNFVINRYVVFRAKAT